MQPGDVVSHATSNAIALGDPVDLMRRAAAAVWRS
jgi:hypothetical protein